MCREATLYPMATMSSWSEWPVKRGSPPADSDHYPTAVEKSADWWVHLAGLTAGGLGGLTLLGLSLGAGRWGQAAAVAVYAVCLLLMFGCSAAYNMAGAKRRPLLRRLDHAGIFLMIAGSYTPFTTQILEGAWGSA